MMCFINRTACGSALWIGLACPHHLQVLSDDEKRGIYDRFGEAGLKGGYAGAGAGGMGGMQGDFMWGT